MKKNSWIKKQIFKKNWYWLLWVTGRNEEGDKVTDNTWKGKWSPSILLWDKRSNQATLWPWESELWSLFWSLTLWEIKCPLLFLPERYWNQRVMGQIQEDNSGKQNLPNSFRPVLHVISRGGVQVAVILRQEAEPFPLSGALTTELSLWAYWYNGNPDVLDVLLSACFTHVPKVVVPHAFCKQAKLCRDSRKLLAQQFLEGSLALLCPSRARLSGSEIGTIGATTFIALILN